jgi:nucleoside-diphosphate-sugar epimerase
MNKKVVISGANGFIGRHLADFFVNQNWEVIALVRKIPSIKIPNVTYEIFNLESPTEIDVFDANTIFIHVAFLKEEKQIDNQDANYYATQFLIELAKKAGVMHSIFFSSLSVSSEVQSYYAYQKRQIETLFDLQKHLIIRPGLVIGNGGLFYSSFKKIEKFRVLPIINGGEQTIYYVAVEDVVTIVSILMENNQTGIHTLYNPKTLSFKEFYTQLFQFKKKKIARISIPIALLKMILLITNYLKITSISKDNLAGLKASETINPENHFSFKYKALKEITYKLN